MGMSEVVSRFRRMALLTLERILAITITCGIEILYIL